MGYCYDMRGRLVCDQCGDCGATRRRKCPSGYCPAAALCPTCNTQVRGEGLPQKDGSRTTWKEIHKDCARRSAEYRAEEDKRRDLMAAGIPVRCSALGYWDDSTRVRVLFATGDYMDARRQQLYGYDMMGATYDAIPLGTVATVDDYRKHGAVVDAPGHFDDVRAIHASMDAEREKAVCRA